MSHEEHHEYLCSILAKLVDSDLTSAELHDLASALGIRVSEFYDDAEPIETIDWTAMNYQLQLQEFAS